MKMEISMKLLFLKQSSLPAEPTIKHFRPGSWRPCYWKLLGFCRSRQKTGKWQWWSRVWSAVVWQHLGLTASHRATRSTHFTQSTRATIATRSHPLRPSPEHSRPECSLPLLYGSWRFCLPACMPVFHPATTTPSCQPSSLFAILPRMPEF